ncbi:MAG TPA: MurR/RpiR family transcriptional regulator [Albitalea sp.]|uniref:MurR/RpiR family transcriptional regulator n=1 Tax=Piscinibacter sp. TaxID=1903157 RepID=UPI002ED350D7
MLDPHLVDSLSPELQRAARWVDAHGSEVALHSMRECARRAGLAPTSFTRLARALGHDGFDTLKQQYQQALAGYTGRARSLQDGARRRVDWTQRLDEAQRANTASVAVLNQRAALESAARAMLQARRVAFLGLRASHGLAFHLHYTYALLASNGQLLHDQGGTLADQLDRLGPTDLLVAISQSPYTRQTVDAVEQARGAGVPVLALTDTPHSPLARGAAHTLLFETDSPSFFHSMVGALALAEALAAAVAVRGGRTVLAHLQQAQQRLEERRAYVERRTRKAAS